MPAFLTVMATFLLAGVAAALERISFSTQDGGLIVSRDDLGSGDLSRLPKIREQYEKAPEPKELVILEGSAHAQFIFGTEQGERAMREILRFLSAR